MRMLLDTNVLINWLVESNQKHKEAERLILSCLMNEFDGFVTSHSLADVFYVLRKYYPSSEQRRKFILIMVHNFTILTEDYNKFLSVLEDEHFFDLEDGLQMKCAEAAQLDYIVTENLKDFTASVIPSICIDDALGKL